MALELSSVTFTTPVKPSHNCQRTSAKLFVTVDPANTGSVHTEFELGKIDFPKFGSRFSSVHTVQRKIDSRTDLQKVCVHTRIEFGPDGPESGGESTQDQIGFGFPVHTAN